MSETTSITWCHHTFNPWWGCVEVSRGCTNCYARSWAKFTGNAVWGKDAPRRFFGEKHWREPLFWDREAAGAGERRRVFCASMADVFEDRDDLIEPRARLFALIAATPHLDWLLLTKRPENITPLMAQLAESGYGGAIEGAAFIHGAVLPNVWWGTTIENNAARVRWAHLKRIPARVLFISAEPQVEDTDFSTILGVEWSDFVREWLPEQIHVLGGHRAPDWLILGGESGSHAAPFRVNWARKIRAQCQAARVAFHMKQMGSFVEDRNDAGFDGDAEGAWPDDTHTEDLDPEVYQGAPVRVRLRHKKGEDPAEWPESLRVREFPAGAVA